MDGAFTYFLLGLILLFSLLTVTSQRLLRSAVYLLFVLLLTAGVYVAMEYYFLAAVQVTLYAGGIVVLIIFSILLTHHIEHRLGGPGLVKGLSSAIVFLAGTGLVIWVLLEHQFLPATPSSLEYSMTLIGTALLNYGRGGYVLPFEVISILVLAAMIGAIAIAKPALLQFRNPKQAEDDQ